MIRSLLSNYLKICPNRKVWHVFKKTFCICLIFLFSHPFQGTAQFVLNNNAVVTTPQCTDATTTYELTADAGTEDGEIWYTTQFSLTNKFDIQFQLYLGGNVGYSSGADGIVFVFQQQSTGAGSQGGGMGFGGITPSLGVEFDTYENGWDPGYCHTAIEKNGDVEHTDGSGNNLAGPVQLSPTGADLPDGAWHSAEIIWNPTNTTLSVYFDCSLRTSYTGNIVSTIFGNNPDVYWGFTAGTGGLENLQEVCIASDYLNNLRDTAICKGKSVTEVVKSAPGSTFAWTPATGLSSTTSATVTATPTTTTTYTCSITNSCSLVSTQTVTITVDPLPVITMAAATEVPCNGGDGSQATTVSGATAPYTYAWSATGGSGATGTDLAAGTYTVTVHDNHGCISTATTVITQPAILTASMSAPTEVACHGGDGSATVSATGGTQPYTYAWSPGGNTNATATTLTAGTYTATVTDDNGCTSSATVVITQPTQLTATMGAPTEIVCNGGTGSATVSATGGTTPYTYSWSPNGGNAAAGAGLTAGTYTATVTDKNGCTATATLTITQPTLLTATMGAPTEVSCNGGVGNATVTVTGGTTPYTYAWTATGGTGAEGTGLTAGTYTVTIHDNHDCEATATVIITQPAVLTATMGTPTEPLCNGETGSATVNVTGGTIPYTYAWTPSGGAGAIGTGLAAGTYTVTVHDNHDCETSATVIITQAPLLTATIGAPTEVVCNGGNNGSATASATGGTLPYTYSWAPNGGNAATGTDLTAGTYTITITDNHDCSSTASVIITQPTLLTTTIGAHTNILCNGGNNGSATASATGGTLPYTYSWAPNGGNAATGNNLTAGTYTVTVTDNHDCSSTATVIITQPTILGVTIGAPTEVLCNGGNNGHATATATGGTLPYTYAWANTGGNAATGTGFSVGVYTVTVHDADGCIATSTVTITQPNVLATTTSFTQASCNLNNGSATATTTGGTTPYIYAWSPSGQTTATEINVSAGSYTVVVTDHDGCTTTTTVTITQPSAVTASIISSTGVSCNVGNNGTATATATGGTSPYTYSWAPNGGNTATGTNLTAGTYTVTVKDVNDCSSSTTVTITQPQLLTATIGAPTNVLCNGGNNGSATASATGGTLPYTYSWAPNGGTTATGNNLTAGTYTVTVTDNHDCSSTATVIITQPTILGVTIGTPTEVLCNGGNNGSATTTATGGTLPYTYAWTNTGGNAATGTGFSVGVYTVTVHDADGCIATSTVTITQPALLSTTTSFTQASCNLSNGSATATTTGGTTPYTYAWSPSGQTTATEINVSAGSYTIVVTDHDGCTTTTTVTITQPSAVTASIISSTGVSCNVGNNGTATATATGGTSPYTYSWAPNGGNTATGTNLTAGTYTVTVKDVNDCSSSATVTITQPQLLTASIGTPTNVLCNGGNNGSATASATGGTLPYTYSWAPNGGTTAIGNNLTAGTYTVTVTDNHDCSSTASVIITQPTLLSVTIGAPTEVLCNGGNNGSATATATGGTLPYTYAWTNTGGNAATGTGFSVGVYTVTVHDADGCIATSTVTITQPNVLATTTSFTQASCNLSNGTATATTTGGTPPYAYIWSPSGQTTATAVAVSAGTYSVFVTDFDGCTTSTTVTVTQPSAVAASIVGSTNVNCFGGNNGTATATATGGTAPYSYVWSPGGNTNAIGTGLSMGTYTMTVTDKNGCISTVPVGITQPTALLASIGAPTNVLCNGGNNGAATATANGGTTPYSFAWSPGGNTDSAGVGLTMGTYTMTVLDHDGCSSTAAVSISQPPLLTVTIGVPINVLCNGGNNGNATASATGGTTPYTYSWSPNGENAATGTGLTAGTYTVTITDADACTATAAVTITQPQVLIATMGAPTNVLCNGGNNGSATVTATGGTLPYRYAWTPNSCSTATAIGISAGTYSVTVTDFDGCTQSTSIIITQPAPLMTIMGIPTNAACNGETGSVNVTATGGTIPYTYAWIPNSCNTANATSLSAGTYTVTVTDFDGCTQSTSATITQPPVLTVTIGIPTNVLCNAGNNGAATATANGGTTPYTYTWTNSGGNTAIGTGFSAGTYTVTVTDKNACTASASVIITQPALLAATTSFTQASCNLYNGSATVTPTGGTLPYTYLWTPSSQTTKTAASISAGIYNVLVTDNDGCNTTATVNVTQPSAVTAAINTVKDISCNGANNGTATATATGGNPPYTYSWAPSGSADATISGLSNGIYTVTIKDVNGCESSASVTITEPNILGVSLDGPTQVCTGTSGTLTATATGGTLPYTYSWAPYITTATSTATVTPPVNTTYTVTVTDANGCTAKATWYITLGPPMAVAIGGATGVCSGKAVTLCATTVGGTGGNKYLWMPGSYQTSCITVTNTVTTTYTAYVTDNCGLVATDTATVTIYPFPEVIFDADLYQGCMPLCIQFHNTSIVAGGGSIESYSWSYGNGDTVSIGNPMYCYPNNGVYSVSLTATSTNGCSSTLKKPDLITVYTLPNAAFTFSPQATTILQPAVQFIDQSTSDAPIIQWYWSTFGDETDSISYSKTPIHTYQDTGTFCPKMTVTDIHGCSNITINCVTVDPIFALYIPAAFTPNSDGLNDVFTAKGDYVKTFEMYIFDRWGQQVYYTNDIKKGWDGTVHGGSTISQEDVYVYKILATDMKNNIHSYTGSVTLLK